jgi:hypothetical protein
MTAPAELSLDVSELYFNSIARLFENPLSPDSTRRLKGSGGLVDFLRARWIVSVSEIEGKGPPQAPLDPLWRLLPHPHEEVDLVDLLVFLICDAAPDSHSWKISDNTSKIRRLNDLEKEEIRDAVLDAADSWTLDFGRLNQGLDEILRFLARLIVLPSVSSSGGHVFFTPSRCEESLSRLAKEISEFPLLPEDFSAVLDIGRSFELMMRFFLALGAPKGVSQSRRELAECAGQMSQRAHFLMMNFGIPGRRQHPGEVRGVLDLIDGQLLPWAVFFEVAMNPRGPREAFQVAWERYSSSDSHTLPDDIKHQFQLFKLDTEEVRQLPDRAFYTPVRIAVMQNHRGQRRGAYSLLRALVLAEQLCETLAPGKDRYLPPPMPSTQTVKKQDKLELSDIPEMA